MSPDGETIWSREYSGDEQGSYECFDLAEMENGNIVMVGTEYVENESIVILIVDENGDEIVAHTYPGEFMFNIGKTVVVDENNNITFGGCFDFSLYVANVNIEGEIQWDFNTETAVMCNDIIRTSDGGYLIIGYDQRIADTFGYVAKLDGEGELEWDRFPDRDRRRANLATAVETDNGYVLVGHRTPLDWHSTTDTDIWIVSYDLDGNLLNNLTIDREIYGRTYCYDACMTSGGNISITGAIQGEDFFHRSVPLLKINPDCEIIYTEVIGEAEGNYATCILQNPDKSYSLFGNAVRGEEENRDYQGLMIKTTPDATINLDYSPNRNDFSLIGAASQGDGVWGNGLDLSDPEGGLAIVEDNESLRPEQFRIEAWFKLNMEIDQCGIIVAKLIEETIPSFMLYADNASGRIGFMIHTENGEEIIERAGDFTDGEWHYIAGDFDGNTVRLIYDESLVGLLEIGASILYDEGPLVFGSDMILPESDFQFYGHIDEVMFSDAPFEEVTVPAQWARLFLEDFAISGVYPNPFNSTVFINYRLGHDGLVTVTILDMMGREISVLLSGYQTAGRYHVVWDGLNSSELSVPNGEYIVRLVTNRQLALGKVVFVK